MVYDTDKPVAITQLDDVIDFGNYILIHCGENLKCRAKITSTDQYQKFLTFPFHVVGNRIWKISL